MRLIDADELVRNILSQTIMNGTDAKIMDRYLYCINNQPTAYDIDKVVEELKKEIVWVDQWGKRYCSQQNAIEIVKNSMK